MTFRPQYCGSTRKGTNKERDAELIKRLQEEAPEVLSAKVNFLTLPEREGGSQ
jgi:hypothetical protein